MDRDVIGNGLQHLCSERFHSHGAAILVSAMREFQLVARNLTIIIDSSGRIH